MYSTLDSEHDHGLPVIHDPDMHSASTYASTTALINQLFV
jgi:hypothetical protein